MRTRGTPNTNKELLSPRSDIRQELVAMDIT
jgi:hypothetical protein